MNMASTTAQFHHQEIGSQTLESMLIPSKSQSEKKAKPCEQALKCPRCDSTNTKFCYYNNYSLSQPRYFCKSCRRYWTKGGTLRNVPVGGGCRKTAKRSSSSKRTHDHQPITTHPTPTPTPIPSYTTSPLSYDHSNAFTLDDHSGFSMPPVAGFLENPSLYYGIGDGINLGLEISGTGMGIGMAGLSQEMGLMGFEEMSGATTSSAAVKQEMCGGRDGEIGRGLWGFPWQNMVGGDGNIGNWNGIGASNWHGLLNTPLM